MVVEILLGGLALLLLVPALVLLIQVLMALREHVPRAYPKGARPAVAVLVPAHDESLVIADTLRSLLPQLKEHDRLLVVADNCTDSTAEIARKEGAEVIERSNREHRGKGYALEFGVRHLEKDPPEVLVIVDADCTIDRGVIDQLAECSHATGLPVQALYLMHSPKNANLKARVAEFAWVVKNHVRALGFHRLGLPCQLMGTGMAFPWSVIQKTHLGNGNIVEDLKLGIDLARSGTPALFCPDAVVSSTFPGNSEGVSSQRTRWEHGHLGIILHVAPRFMWDALCRRDVKQLALALDLCVPPLSLMVLLALSIFACSVIVFLMFGRLTALSISSFVLIAIATSVMAAWIGYGKKVITLVDLACVPFYVLWKIPLYVKFVFSRQAEWVRSKRDESKP